MRCMSKVLNRRLPTFTMQFSIKRMIDDLKVCFYDEKNRREFEQWYLEKYGKPYVWKVNVYDENGDRIGTRPIENVDEYFDQKKKNAQRGNAEREDVNVNRSNSQPYCIISQINCQ